MSTKRYLTIFSFLVLALALGACQGLEYSQAGYALKSDGGSMCTDNSDCEEWEVCVYGTCTDQGYGYCDDDSDCEDGYVCMYNYCEEDYYECYTDEDCGPGYYCMDGYCEEDYYDCYTDVDCYPGETCEDGYCEWNGGEDCYYDYDCEPGQTCEEGICVGGGQLCYFDTDCPAGQVCQAGACVDGGQGCATNYDCPDGQICDPATFTCIDDPTGCNPPCDPGYVCQNGACIDDSGCSDECSPPGSSQCADEASTLVCGDFDDDSCYELGDPQPCDDGQVCQVFSASSGACRNCGNKWDPCCPGSQCNGDLVCDNGTCNDAASGCSDECSMFSSPRVCSDDSTRGAGYLECGDYDDDSCTEYGPHTPCDAGMVCQSGRCIPDCGDDCDPPVEGLWRCEDDYTRSECLDLIGETCATWGDPIACATGTRCNDGACVQCDFLDICDGIDNDCDGDIDEDDDCSAYAAPGCSCATGSRNRLGSSLFMLLALLTLVRRRLNANG